MDTQITLNNVEALEKITDFLKRIGIECKEEILSRDTFLPGVDIVKGCIVYDPASLLSPGDLLHEAGHLAVLKPEDRPKTNENISGDMQEGAAEMAAIAWSWAALKHIDIAPEVVFHKKGYRGGSDSLIENFSLGRYIGVPILAWHGMTNEIRDTEATVHYPAMVQWLRQ